MEIECKICKVVTTVYIKNIFDDRYGYPEVFDVNECPNCSSFITVPPLKIDEIEPLYTNYYPRKNINPTKVKERAHKQGSTSSFRKWLSGEHRIHRILQKSTRANVKVLDIGCGDGSSLLELKSLGYDAYGIETDRNIEIIRDELNLNIFIGPIEKSPFVHGSFNYVIANQVIEHLIDLETFMLSVNKFLAPHGILIISTPNAKSIFRKIYGKKWIHWHIPYHQQILNKKALETLFKKYDCIIKKVRTVSPSSWTVHEINRLRFNASVGIKNPFWSTEEKIDSSLFGKIFRRIIFLTMAGVGKIADIFYQGNCLIIYGVKK